jgi:hypothetical protein
MAAMNGNEEAGMLTEKERGQTPLFLRGAAPRT